MSIKRNQLTIDLINIVLRFMLMYLIITIVLHKVDPSSALHTLFLLPAPFISYAIRKYTLHIWSFLLLHIMLLALYVIAVRGIFLTVAYVIYLVLLMILAYYDRNKMSGRTNTSLFTLIVFVALSIGSYFADMPDMIQLCFVVTIAFILLYILNSYFLNLDNFMHNHEHITNVPYSQIRNSNNVLVAFLCSLFFIAMLLFSWLPLRDAVSSLGKLMIRFLRFLFSLLSSSEPEEIEKAAEKDIASTDMLPKAEASYLMELLATIFQWLATAAIIIAVVLLVLYTIYKIYRYFYLQGEKIGKDEVEFISPFLRTERLKRESKPIFRKLFGRSNNDAIRKYFTKAVVSNIGKGMKLPKHLTPSQLSKYAITEPTQSISSKYAITEPTQSITSKYAITEPTQTITSEDEERRRLLTSVYEKARYSGEECTKDEVQIVKNILK